MAGIVISPLGKRDLFDLLFFSLVGGVCVATQSRLKYCIGLFFGN